MVLNLVTFSEQCNYVEWSQYFKKKYQSLKFYLFIFSSAWNLNVAELLTLPGTNPEIDGVYVQVMMFLTQSLTDRRLYDFDVEAPVQHVPQIKIILETG